MSCPTCGREAENDHQGHWLGCDETAGGRALKAHNDALTAVAEAVKPAGGECEHDGCSEPKASKGPRAKWCETHKDPKNREN